MANIYYCQAITSSGILRAALSPEEGICLLRKRSAQYAGQQFPTTQDRAVDFAVLRIFERELGDEWQSGFYRFDAHITEIEESIQACTTALPKPK
jgi:hypothetical protein